jgi:hypothetical protein
MSSLLGFVALAGSTTEHILGYLERHHWFFLGFSSLAIYFIFTTKAFMLDLTLDRRLDGSGSSLLATTDWQRRESFKR